MKGNQNSNGGEVHPLTPTPPRLRACTKPPPGDEHVITTRNGEKREETRESRRRSKIMYVTTIPEKRRANF